MSYLVFAPETPETSLKEHLQQTVGDCLRLVARGARQRSSSYTVSLSPAAHCDYSWVLLRSDIPILPRYRINGLDCRPLKLSRHTALLHRWALADWENIVTLPFPVRCGTLDIMPILAEFPAAASCSDVASCVSRLSTGRGESLPGSYILLSREGQVLERTDGRLVVTVRAGKTNASDAKSSAELALRFLTNAQIRTGRFKGSFFGAWDHDYHTYRLTSWIWSAGPVVHAFLDYGHVAPAQLALEHLSRLQLAGGRNSGAWPVRWDILPDSVAGVVEWLAPNDVAYLASQGFVTAYKVRGDATYLAIAKRAADWVIREALMPHGQLSYGFRTDLQRWETTWLYVDAGFTAELFSELYTITGDNRYRLALSKFIHWYIAAFQGPSGHFLKAWRAYGQHDCRLFARGHAWALAGLLAASRVLSDEPVVLSSLQTLLDVILDSQSSSGAWYYLLNKPPTGRCAKATAVLAYYLAHAARAEQVPAATRDRCMASLQRAISWCEEHQSRQADSPGYGGIHSWTIEGAIVGKRGTDVSFSYAAAFYLLALHEIVRQEVDACD